LQTLLHFFQHIPRVKSIHDENFIDTMTELFGLAFVVNPRIKPILHTFGEALLADA
jgi:hypothetical protein